MALAPGTRLGPYEILAPLGAGGMGEVYRAKDTRLARDVAVKVLPEDFLDSEERRARFEREAKLLAALNHPNIAAIHSFEEVEERHVLVMELLEGESLREALSDGALPQRKAIDFGAQIADGLAAAHSKGIVHRDLKPDNVFVTREGHVKILDFGLARQMAISSSVETNSPTEAKATMPGEVLGTVGYFSPEQVRGLPADSRSDIFAFGCVLHEMLSGKRAFKRETAAESMTAVLREEPRALEASSELAALVNRCLEKRPEMRFQSAQDLAFALRSLLSAPALSHAEVPLTSRRPALSWLIPGAAAFVLVAVVIGVLRGRAPSPPLAAVLNPKRILVVPFENATGDPSLDPIGRLTADWISQGLLQTESVEVVTLGVGPGAANPQAPAEKGLRAGDSLKTLATANGAGTVVSGSYYASGKDLEFQGRLTDAAAGKLLFALEPVRAPREEPMPAIDRVRQRMMGAVVTQFDLSRVAAVIQKPPSYEAYVEYMAGFELVGFDNEKTRQHLERAVALDPDFIVARIRLAAVYAYVGETARSNALFTKLRENSEKMTPVERLFLDFLQARVEGKLLEAYKAARDLHALVPKDVVVLWQLAENALFTNRPRECLDALSGMGPWEAVFKEASGRYRQLTWYVTTEAQARHLLVQHEKELAVARMGLTQFPDMLSMNLRVASALAALGRTAELDQALEASLSVPPRGTLTSGEVMLETAGELRAHGHRDAALKVAGRAADWFTARLAEEPPKERLAAGQLRSLCLLERWDEARAAAARFAKEFPESGDVTGYRGVLAARSGDRAASDEASASLTHVHGRDRLRVATYRRACIAAQLGEKDRAVGLLREAFTQGEPLIVTCHADWRLDPLRGYAPFEELVKPKG